jgi:hypothetical protein
LRAFAEMGGGFDPEKPGFDLRLETESSALVANVTGWIDSADALLTMFGRIAAEVRRTGVRRLLVVDHTFGVVPPEDQLHRLVTGMAGQGFEQVRLAYVDARGTAVSRMEVAEILARERGYECRVFDNESRARIWLHYGEN